MSIFDYMLTSADRSPTKLLAQAAGYEVYHGGGGSLAWCRRCSDGTLLLVSGEDDSISDQPDDATWIVGRYADDGSFVAVTTPTTFAEAVRNAERLPAPSTTDGSALQETFTSIEAAELWQRDREGC